MNQPKCLKPYVKVNTKAETKGKKDEKVLYKLMNNAVYGKTTENLENMIDVRLVSNKKDYLN